MKRTDIPQDGRIETEGDEAFVAGLLRSAGARSEPPNEDYARVLAASTATLERVLARRRRRAWHRPLALAAALAALAGGLAWLLSGPIGSGVPLPVAEVARVLGEVRVRGADEVDDRPLVAGIGVQSGSTLSTSVGGRVALRLADGGELRLDRSTRLRFESPRRLRLLQGALYVDSDAGAGEQGLRETASELEIVTDQAIARDVGTRFEVRLDGRSYRLRVRDGRVDLRHASGLYSSGPGEQLLIESDGRVRPGRIVLDDADWAWIETLSTAPEIENQPLRRVLDWVTRETGRPIRFSPGELEHDASRAILHGSIDGLAPLDALATVLASSGLRYRIERDGSILISKD